MKVADGSLAPIAKARVGQKPSVVTDCYSVESSDQAWTQADAATQRDLDLSRQRMRRLLQSGLAKACVQPGTLGQICWVV